MNQKLATVMAVHGENERYYAVGNNITAIKDKARLDENGISECEI